jgi:rhomboid family GlyGly-CTERM serine protease
MLYDSLKRKFPFLVILSLIIITLVGQKFAPIFLYDRAAILNGEYWRILTCHFVHTNWYHLFLNLTASLLVFSLFLHLYSPFGWLIGATFCIIGISLSFLFFYPTLEWYMGLSGLLHGLFVMGIIGEIRKGNILYCFGLLAVTAKLSLEYFIGPSNITIEFINALVITNAHLSGAIMGCITAYLIIFAQKILLNQSIKLTAIHAA